jgi:hypothetical protein
MVVAAMAVVIVNCAAVFDAVATITSLSLTAMATTAIAALQSTAAAQSMMVTKKAIVNK